MKRIEKLSLTKLSKKELNYQEMNRVKGGTNGCQCGCCYSIECGGDGSGSDMQVNANCNDCTGKTTYPMICACWDEMTFCVPCE